MLKYVQVDSDGYAYLSWENQNQLHARGYAIGRANDEWILFRLSKWGEQISATAILYETTDHVLFDNYLKLLLED
jgi:hypothetical protein